MDPPGSPMDVAIRDFLPDDVPAAIRMWEGAEGVLLDDSDSPERVRSFLRANHGLSFVAVDEGGDLLGSILCSHDTRRGYIYHLAVRDSARRLGIGRRLARASMHALGEQGIGKCHIHVLTANAAAIDFWKAAGWTVREDIRTLSGWTHR